MYELILDISSGTFKFEIDHAVYYNHKIYIIIAVTRKQALYSGDLNSQLVRYSNGPKQLAHKMFHYSSNVVNSKLIVSYSSGNKFGNQMAFGNQIF